MNIAEKIVKVTDYNDLTQSTDRPASAETDLFCRSDQRHTVLANTSISTPSNLRMRFVRTQNPVLDAVP